jgi:bifunctional non-homologous end joining protein LigD
VRAIGYLGDDQFRLISRNDRDITAAYPELVPPGKLAEPGLIVDGEIVAFDEAGKPSFAALQPRMHLRDPARIARQREQTPVAYIVFDVLRHEDQRVTGQTYRERRTILGSLDLSAVQAWQAPDYQVGDGARLYEATRGAGLEGLIAKRLDSTYQPGRRSGDWIKIKHVLTQEVVVGGWTPGEGRREGAIGSLLLGIPDPVTGGADGVDGVGGTGRRKRPAKREPAPLRYVGLVGTGFSDRTLKELGKQLASLASERSPFLGHVPTTVEREARWVRPQLVGEVVYAERTRDGLLRTPAWRGLRPDKEPSEVRPE